MKHYKIFFILQLILLLLCTFTHSEVVEQKCISYGNHLSRASTRFLECSFNNSRPLNICKNCVEHYLQFRELYNLMANDSTQYATTLYDKGLVCRDIIEARDRVQYNFHVIDLILNIWDKLNCNSCFDSYSLNNGTVNFTLTDNVNKFYDYYQDLEYCIFNATKRDLSLDPIFDTYSPNSSLCIQCKDSYINLTNFFNTEIKENEFCMDVVDAFNYTRVAWSKGFKCSYRNPDPLYFKIICGVCTAITVLFYVFAKMFGVKEEKKFVPMFRKKSSIFYNSDASYN